MHLFQPGTQAGLQQDNILRSARLLWDTMMRGTGESPTEARKSESEPAAAARMGNAGRDNAGRGKRKRGGQQQAAPVSGQQQPDQKQKRDRSV